MGCCILHRINLYDPHRSPILIIFVHVIIIITALMYISSKEMGPLKHHPIICVNNLGLHRVILCEVLVIVRIHDRLGRVALRD
jgi:hypothetical protein